MLCFFFGFESEQPKGFPRYMYFFFVCGGETYLLKNFCIFLKNGSEEFFCCVFRYGLFLSQHFDTTIVLLVLIFYWIAFNLRSFLSTELLHMVGFSQRKLPRGCDSHRQQIRPLVHFFCAKFFEVESVERHQDVTRFSIDCPLHSIYKIETSQLSARREVVTDPGLTV